MAEPVDVLLNLARIAPEELVALVALVKPGGVVVNTIPTIPTPSDEARDVRAVGVFVRSDAEQLSQLTALVDAASCASTSRSASRWPSCPPCTPRATPAQVSGKVVVVIDNNN